MHFTNAFVKLTVFLLTLIVLTIINSLFAKSFLLITTLLICVTSNINPKLYLKLLWRFKILYTVIILFNLIFQAPIISTISSLITLVIIFLLASTFIFTTKQKDIIVAIDKLLFPLSKLGIKTHDIAMIISLTLNFIPNIIEQASRIIKAQVNRGLHYDKTIIQKIKATMGIVFPLFISTIKKSDSTAITMETRLYNQRDNKKVNYNHRLAGYDIMILTTSLVILIIVFMKGY